MNHIITLENNYSKQCRNYYSIFLLAQKRYTESKFDWINLEIRGRSIIGKGNLLIGKKKFKVELSFSPFNFSHFDRIRIIEPKIEYNDRIHLYRDKTLCLYHPIIDKPTNKIIQLHEIIPWISEWCVHYLEWKKYGVWLGEEIQH